MELEPILHPMKVIRSSLAGESVQNVQKLFASLIADPSTKSKVPVYTEDTAEAIPNQTLVRYIGMVQDMPSPEYYVGEFQRADGSWQSTMYCDQLEDAMPPHAPTRISERKPLLLVPVPGQAAWRAQQAQQAARASTAGLTVSLAASAQQGGGPKRGREDSAAACAAAHADLDGDDISMGVSEATGCTRLEGGAGGEDTAASRSAHETAAGGRARVAAPAADDLAPAQHEGQAGEELPPGCCMVYLYEDSPDLRLNDVVEVVGVLSRVPDLAAAHMAPPNEASLMFEDVLASHLPTSRVPRVHAILANPLKDPYFAQYSGLSAPETPKFEADSPALSQARARVVGFLSMVLGGDDLAAEYLLLQLVSRVHLRNAESAVGVLPLNITGCPPGDKPTAGGQGAAAFLSPLAASLAAALDALAPATLALPLSVEALNKRPWWPRRNQTTQRLMPSPLQLAPGTQLLLDETVLAAGTLNEVGLRNLAALQQLMKVQRVSYDFEVFSLDQPTEAPPTVLSLGRTLLKDAGGLQLPLQPSAPLGDPATVSGACASADLAPLRAYLAAVRQLEVDFDQGMQGFLEGELAAARQKDPSLVNQETLHAWLNVARLSAVSFGETRLTRQRWDHAMGLEAQRRQRVGAARRQPRA